MFVGYYIWFIQVLDGGSWGYNGLRYKKKLKTTALNQKVNRTGSNQTSS